MQKKRSFVRATTWLLVALFAMASLVPTVSAEAAQSGDVDLNGRLNIADSGLLYRYSSGITDLSLTALEAADVNDDGRVDFEDAMSLYASIAGSAHLGDPWEPDKPPVSEKVLYGIDVSYAQGEVDWAKVKQSGVDFAVLRCGYGQDEIEQDDECWNVNAAACEAYDIPYGTYFFCYARTVQEAQGEVQHALRLLKGKNLTLPVFYDMEYSSWQGDLSNETYAAIAQVFCGALEEAGYKVGVYANLDWWENRLTAPCFDDWYRWVAQYNDECDYEGTYHLWQFSDAGTVSGVDGMVDENYAFIDFGLLAEGLSEE